MVSTLTGTPARSSALMTGPTRRSSSSAGTPCAPGLVDSPSPSPRCAAARVGPPPTSTMSAPCPASSRPRAIAASAPNQEPPSENESGVTFTTPMTRHRDALGRPGRTGPPEGAGVRPGRPVPAAVVPASLMSVTLCAGGSFPRPPQAAPGTGQAQLAGQPPQLQFRPDQERLGFKRGHADPHRIPGAGEG